MNTVSLTALASLALSAGFISAFNPCGFAMMPAYLSYFLGIEGDKRLNPAQSILRGLGVGLTLCAGFMTVFAAIGALASTVLSRSAIESRVAWVTFVLGILMGVLGMAMLLGFEPKFRLPRMQRGGNSRRLSSIFLFGVSYAIVSLGCTMPVFFGTVVSAFSSRDLLDGLLVFLAYGGGLCAVIMVLTLAMAVARTEVLAGMRRILPHVNRISGAFLMVVGAFLALYGHWEVQVLRGNLDGNVLVDLSLDAQGSLSSWASGAGPSRLAVAAGYIVAGVVLMALRASMRPRNARLALAAFGVLWLAVEGAYYRFDLFVLPILRTIADVPERVANWSDPLRWAVLFELLAAVAVGAAVWFRLRRLRRPRDRRHRPRQAPGLQA